MKIQYPHTDIWHIPEQVPHPTLSDLLHAKNQLIVLQSGPPPYQVVLGVPHHVPNGVYNICEERRDEHGNINSRKGDDNAASFALVTFSQLAQANISCKLVIMAHATTQDPNKVLDSPYCQEIFREKSALLFECHASSGRRTLELELSAGRNRLGQTVRFGHSLAAGLEYRYLLGVQTHPGQREALIFEPGGETTPGVLQLPAIKTTSLWAAEQHNIPALHLETKPRFRLFSHVPGTISPDGLILGRAIAKTIRLC
jgi:hypothetical protein